MAKKDYLIDLIATLSATDKRNFTLYNNILPGDKKYLRLYEVLQGKDHYNVKELCQELGLEPRQLADYKYYLGQVLLKSLRNFDEDVVIQTRVTKDFVDAQILYDRNMWEHALDAFEKLISQARHYEIMAFVPMLLTSKRSCLTVLKRLDELPAIDKEIQESICASLEFNEIWNFSSQCMNMDIKRNSLQAVHKLLKHPLFKKQPDKLKTLKAAACLMAAEYRLHWMAEDAGKILALTRKQSDFWKRNPRYLEVDPVSYIASFTAVAQAEVKNGEYDRALKSLEYAQAHLTPPPKHLRATYAQSALYFILHTRACIWRITGNYKEAVLLGQELYKADYIPTTFERYGHIFELALALLQSGRANEAYDKMEELIQIKEEIRNDMQPYVRIALVMCELQRRNYEVVPYLVRTVKAWLKRKKIKNAEFDLLLSHAYAIAKAPPLTRPGIWKNMEQAVTAGKFVEFDKTFYGLSSWVKMQITHSKEG